MEINEELESLGVEANNAIEFRELKKSIRFTSNQILPSTSVGTALVESTAIFEMFLCLIDVVEDRPRALRQHNGRDFAKVAYSIWR